MASGYSRKSYPASSGVSLNKARWSFDTASAINGKHSIANQQQSASHSGPGDFGEIICTQSVSWPICSAISIRTATNQELVYERGRDREAPVA